MRIYTIGHSSRSTGELIELLRAAGVSLVIDVRRYPHSRRHPQFDRESLRASLAESGIGYRHIEALGGRRPRILSDDASPNTGWDVAGFRDYADYALTPPFRDALTGLIAMAGERTAAVMCAEALWWQCHRRIVTDHLLVAGIEVVHILGPGQTEPAVLTPAARPRADGSIVYPPAQPRLL